MATDRKKSKSKSSDRKAKSGSKPSTKSKADASSKKKKHLADLDLPKKRTVSQAFLPVSIRDIFKRLDGDTKKRRNDDDDDLDGSHKVSPVLRKLTKEEEAAAAKAARRARLEIADYVDTNLDVDPAMSRSMEKGFDDSVHPLAKNFFDFITNPVYLKDVELRAKQLEAAINLLTDYCPLCSDAKYAKCIPYKHRAKKIAKRIVFLVHGRCPKCRITRTRIWKKGLLPRYTELAGLAGQRGGKTQLVAYLAAYTLHRFLKLKNPPVTYGLLPSTPLTLTFTAVTFKQAHQYLYTSFYNVVMHSSPWFKNYHEALDRFGQRTGREVYRFKDTLFHYKHKNLFGMAEAPDSRSLRGATRWFASIDEIGHFNAKCLVGNSLVPTDEGLLTLEELKEQSSSNSEGFSDLNVGVCTHLGTKARTDKAFKSRGKTFVVETDCGERIEGLREHSMWSYCKGEMKFTRLDELPVGAYLPKSIGTKLFAKKSPTINFKRHISANAKILDDFTVPKKMTEGIGYLFGLFVAEGTRQGFFSNHNPALLDFFKDGLKKEFGASREFVYGLRNGKRDRVGVSLCKHVTAFFNHYLGSELSDKKVVPEIIRRSPAHIQTSFLRGLFEGDGTVYPYNKTKSYLVSYTSVSETLVRQVKALLENMGVLCHLALDETNPRKNSAYKPAHILFINRESYETFKAVAGFMPGSVKSQKLDKAIAYKETQIDKRTSRAFGRAHFVPARELILELYSELKEICSNTVYGYWYTSRTGNDVWVEKKYKLDAILHDSHHPARLQNGMEATKRSIDSIISAIEDAPTALRVNVSKNKRVTQIIKELRYMQQFYWTRIKSVKATDKTKPVFDLSVPGPHSYHVNSLIGHNTKDAIKINADEVHIALNRSLLSLRSASRRLHEEGHYDIPQPLFCNVSSPFSITDKICSLVEDSKRPNSPIYSFHYCLPGKTLIPTENGLMRIDELATNKTGNTRTLNIKVLGKHKAVETTHWHYSGKKKLLGFRLRSGHKLEASTTHPVCVLKNGKHEWIEASKIQKGDLLCINTQTLNRKRKLLLNLKHKDGFSRPDLVKQILLPKRMNVDLAFAIAAITAEGYFCDQTVRVANNNVAWLKKIKRIIDEQFGLNGTIKLHAKAGVTAKYNGRSVVTRKDVYSLWYANQSLCHALKQLGLNNNRTPEKKASWFKVIPWSILQADAESQKAFIAGYVEADGYIVSSKHTIGISSASEELRQQFQLLLNTHGVLTNIKGVSVISASEKDCYTWYELIRPYLTIKCKTINASGSKLQGIPVRHLRTFIQSRKLPRKGANVCRAYADDGSIVELHDSKTNGSQIVRGTQKILPYDSIDSGLFDGMLSDLKKISKAEYSKFQALLKTRYWYSPVVDITNEGVFDTYDLTINSMWEPAFVANGIVVHNSSYKMNPTLSKEDTRSEREADYTKYKRDYLAIPPMAANVFISSKSIIRSSFDPELENLIDVTQRMVKTRTGRHMLTAEFEINENHPRYDAPKLLALDAGYSFNSFAGALIGIEPSEDNPNDHVFVTDALFEIIPEKNIPIDFSLLYEDLLLPIIKQLGVVAVYADRWQSLKLLQDIIKDTDEEVDAKTYSPNYGDFLQYRNYLTKGQIIIPQPEIEKISTIMHFATRNYPQSFAGKPVSHMVMQMMTVNDVFGKTIMKGDKLTDDLFRAHVLAITAADDPEMLELLKVGLAGASAPRQPIGIMAGTGGIVSLGGKGGGHVGPPGSGFGGDRNVPVMVSHGRPMGFF